MNQYIFSVITALFLSVTTFAETPVLVVTPPIVTNINPLGDHDLILANRFEAREMIDRPTTTYAYPLNLTLIPGVDHFPSDAELETTLLAFKEQNVILLVDHKSELGVDSGLKITALSDDKKTAELVRCTYLSKVHPKLTSETCTPLR